MISVIVCTYRPAGWDITIRSFLEADGDYEIVVVDDWPGRVERGSVPAYFAAHGLGHRLGWYGPSKPKAYPDAKGGLANAWNTAISHARGDFLVFLSDYTFLPRGWLPHWDRLRDHHQGRALISGAAIVYDAPKPSAPGDVETWTAADGAWTHVVPKWPWVAWQFESFYAGYPLAFFEKTNGMDERSDHCHCWPVSSNIAHAGRLGYQLLVVPELACHMIDHRVWDNPAENRDLPPPGCGSEGLWRITDRRSLPDEPDWTVPAGNNGWSLAAARKANGL